MASWFGVAPTVPTVSGIVHLANVGDVPFANSQFAGKAGSQVEAFTLQLNPPVAGLGIEYSCHQAQVGDTKWVANGELQGSRGQSRAIQGISVRLVGPSASQYQVNYTVAGIGSVSPASNGAFLGTKGQNRAIEGFQVWLTAVTVAAMSPAPGITGVAHVANVGDTALSTNVFVGGQTKTNRIEGLSIQLSPPSSDLGIEYGAHQAGVGDLPWQSNGAFLGSRGQSRALESVSIRLTGPRSSQYTVHYSGVVDGLGEQAAVSDGAPLGTKGQSRALCGLRIWITAKQVFVFPAPAVEGLVHRAQVGDVHFSASQFVGGKKEGKQLEGFTLQLNPAVPDLGIEYTAHQEGAGDLPWVSGGTYIGSRGQSKRLEGIAVRLTGAQAQYFSVHYYTTVVGQSDTPPVSDGTFCGTKGQSRAIEGLQVWITAKPIYGVAPTTTGHYKPFAYQ